MSRSLRLGKGNNKNNVISIVVTLLFILGFVILVNYSESGITGLTGLYVDEINNSQNETFQDDINFETEAVWFGSPAGTQWGGAYEPINRSRTIDDRSIDFVFNTSAAGIHNQSNLTSHTVGNWRFERDSAKNYADPTVNNGTISALITNTTGIIGYAYDFSVSRIDTPLGLNYRNITISLWLKPDDITTNQYISDANSGQDMAIVLGYQDNYFNIYNNNAYITGTVADTQISATLNTWQHIVITSNGTDTQGYKDGVQIFDVNGNFTNNGLSQYDFGSTTAGLAPYNGIIDEVIIWNRTLSSGEISQIYNDTLGTETRTINNCSLLLNIDNAGYSVNTTYNDTVFHNQSNVSSYTVGNWRFEQDSAKNYADPTVNNGTLVGDPQNTTGIVGYGYEFDAIGDYIDCGKDMSLNITGNITVLAWIKPKVVSGYQVIVSKSGGSGTNTQYELRLNGDDVEFLLTDDTTRIASKANVFVVDKWAHVVGAVNDTDIIVYVDGIEGTSDTLSGTRDTTTENLCIGCRKPSTGSLPWNGLIDEVLIFNRTLTSGEISQIYNDTNDKINFEGYNTTIPVDFDFEQHDINWKVQCYDDLDIPWNSSEMYFELDALVTQSAPNIGAHAYYDKDYVVGQWRFEQVASGNDGVFDETGINNATLINGPKWCPDDGDSAKWNCSGRIGKGVMFDGVDGFVNITRSVSLEPGEMTISYWCYVATLGVRNCYFTKLDSAADTGYFSGLLSDIFYFQAGDGVNWAAYNVYIDSAITSTGWYHVVGTLDSNNVYIYLNGVRQTTTDTGGTIVHATDKDLWFGRNIDSPTQYSVGTLDEVTVWNRSLSNEEVKQLYYSSAVSYNSTFSIQDISASNNLTQDEDNDTIKFIYNWYVNNESMAVLNMPFEAVNNGSEMNFSKDYSGYENHGSTQFNSDVFDGSSGWNRTGGVDGFGAYEFDGDGDYIKKTINDWNNVETGTISAWIKKSATGLGTIFSTSNEGVQNQYVYLSIDGSNNLAIIQREADTEDYISGGTTINSGQWYHVVATSDGSSYSLYVNGIDEGTLTVNTGSNSGDWFADTTNRDHFSIGVRIRASPGVFFNGTIDEVMIFNRSLSAEQIKALYLNQTQTIKSQETVKGQSWKAEVTANDGYGDSLEYNTSELFIDDVTLKVGLQKEPINYYNSSTSSVNFTYNVTDQDSIAGVINCSLWLYKSGSWELNKTKDYPDVNINQTLNITIEDINLNWTIACYDKEHEQTNSSNYNLTIDSVAPVVNIYEPDDEAIDTDGIVSHIYNMSDNVAISNCTLYTNTSFTAYTVKDTDTSITKEINQSINVTYTSSETINWKIGCYNIYGLQGNSSSRELTIQISVTAEEEEEVVGGGSSSGAGSSGARQASTITSQKQVVLGNVYTIDKLTPGETELMLSDPTLSIVAIYLDSSKEAENVELKIEETRNINIEKPDRRVYRYLNLETNMPESFFNKIRIIFKLHKGYGDDIKVLRYTSSWLALDTKKINTDDYYDYYEAVSPGFSYFAITSKKLSEQIYEELTKAKERVKEVLEQPTKKDLFVVIGIPALILTLAVLLLLGFFIKLIKKIR